MHRGYLLITTNAIRERERDRGSDKGLCGGGLHSHLLYAHVELDGCVENIFTYKNIQIYQYTNNNV
jgi:hypothetical protein